MRDGSFHALPTRWLTLVVTAIAAAQTRTPDAVAAADRAGLAGSGRAGGDRPLPARLSGDGRRARRLRERGSAHADHVPGRPGRRAAGDGAALGPVRPPPRRSSSARRSASLAGVVCALAPNLAVLAVARLVQGFAGAGGMVIGRAVIADLVTGRAAAQAFTLMLTVGGVAPVLAPLVGGLLAGPGRLARDALGGHRTVRWSCSWAWCSCCRETRPAEVRADASVVRCARCGRCCAPGATGHRSRPWRCRSP